MIGISRLYCSTVEASDPLRYGRLSDRLPSHLLQFSADARPVVVLNLTRACNLRCAHCYAACDSGPEENELTGPEVRTLLEDLAGFGSPVVLFSGGEPLARPDCMELLACAKQLGLRTVLSTNGTLIDEARAARLGEIGVSYVGISLDAVQPDRNDAFRGKPGAFQAALEGLRHARTAGLKVGLRFTIHAGNVGDVPGVFDLAEREGIGRICFYHLVPTGRGVDLQASLLPNERTRQAVESIMDRTRQLHEAGKAVEVLTVDNHADAGLLLMRLQQQDPARAEVAWQLLRMNGGNGSGRRIGCVSWDGSVHPDQFWRSQVLGNVRDRPFSELWADDGIELLRQLRNRREHLDCRCLDCRFLEVCNGNLRARAEAAGNGTWGDDPACYLTDAEIAECGAATSG